VSRVLLPSSPFYSLPPSPIFSRLDKIPPDPSTATVEFPVSAVCREAELRLI